MVGWRHADFDIKFSVNFLSSCENCIILLNTNKTTLTTFQFLLACHSSAHPQLLHFIFTYYMKSWQRQNEFKRERGTDKMEIHNHPIKHSFWTKNEPTLLPWLQLWWWWWWWSWWCWNGWKFFAWDVKIIILIRPWFPYLWEYFFIILTHLRLFFLCVWLLLTDFVNLKLFPLFSFCWGRYEFFLFSSIISFSMKVWATFSYTYNVILYIEWVNCCVCSWKDSIDFLDSVFPLRLCIWLYLYFVLMNIQLHI